MGLAGFFLACFVAASSGAIFKPGDWYEALRKPSWRPPNWLFPVAWSILYCMIAVAGWRVWLAAGFAGGALPLAIYGVQLVLNGIWSGLFFGLRRMDLALAELGLLWLSILGCLITFWPVDETAALLMLPYFAWVSFAGFLNWTMLRLNPRAA